MRALLVEAMVQDDANPFAAMGLAFAGAFIDPMIDGVVSPEGIKVIVQNGKMKAARMPAAAEDTAGDEGREAVWEIDRRGIDGFVASTKSETGDEKLSLIFRRDGLSWDLVDIELPVEAFAKAASGKRAVQGDE